MLRHLRKWILGGRSDKREQAWLVFAMWAAAFLYAAYQEAHGNPMEGTQAILTAIFLPVLANLTLAHGMEWFGSQSKWKVDE